MKDPGSYVSKISIPSTHRFKNFGLLVTAGGDVIAKSARGYEQKGECLVSIGLVKLATNDLIRDLGKLDPTGEA